MITIGTSHAGMRTLSPRKPNYQACDLMNYLVAM